MEFETLGSIFLISMFLYGEYWRLDFQYQRYDIFDISVLKKSWKAIFVEIIIRLKTYQLVRIFSLQGFQFIDSSIHIVLPFEFGLDIILYYIILYYIILYMLRLLWVNFTEQYGNWAYVPEKMYTVHKDNKIWLSKPKKEQWVKCLPVVQCTHPYSLFC